MRVIFLSPHSDPQAKLGEPDAGGQCIFEHELAMKLAENNIEVATFCRQRDHHPSVTKVRSGYTIYRITAAGEKFVPKEKIIYTLPEFVHKVSHIIESLDHESETIVHSHYWDGVAAALLLKSNYHDYPLIWTPHSLGFAKREKYGGIDNETFYHFIPRIMWESYGALIANRIIVLSKNEKRKLINYYGVKSHRISTIHPGVSIDKMKLTPEYREKLEITPDTHVLLTIGRMSRNKGYHHAIRIADRLRHIYTENFKLVIVGGSSRIGSMEEQDYQRRLRLLVRKLHLENYVIFMPSVEHSEIGSIYSLSDIYLMTSENEPFGLTVIEAMALGKTVIAHSKGGGRDVIKNGITGFVTDMHKYDNVAQLIAKLFQSNVRRAKIGLLAQESIAKKYSWDSTIPQYASVYNQIKSVIPTRLKKTLLQDSVLRSLLNV